MLLVETAPVPAFAMDQDQQYSQDLPYTSQPGQWIDQQPPPHPPHSQSHYPPPHAASQHDFGAYTFGGPPSTPMSANPYIPSSHAPPRFYPSQLQSLVMPQWPSGQPGQPIYPSPIHHGQHEGMATAPQLGSNHQMPPQTQPNPRRTLTDSDRRKMCLYHEEHPQKKQTEIGEIFGVERSTVSKVLRQKEKYLALEDGGRSPIKRVRAKIPDLERALAKWVQNQSGKGTVLSDEAIMNQARTFLATSGSGAQDSQLHIEAPSWLEKFKQKNNINQSRGRRGSTMEEAAEPSSNSVGLGLTSSVSDPNLASSAQRVSSPAARGQEGDMRNPHFSQSNPSLSSAFAESGHSTFASSTSTGSPLFSPDAAGNASSYFPGASISSNAVSRTGSIGAGDRRRRSSNLAQSGTAPGDAPYWSPSQSSVDPGNPMYGAGTPLESPVPAMHPPSLHHYGSGSSLGARALSKPDSHYPTQPHSAVVQNPSFKDAWLGLEAAMAFMQTSQESMIESEDVYALSRIVEKFRRRQHAVDEEARDKQHELPGGLHRISEVPFDGQAGRP